MRKKLPGPDAHIKSLLRGLDILRCLGASPQGLTLRELSDALGLKDPTVYKTLQTLLAARFAAESGHPVVYSLGPAAFDLATSASSLLYRAENVMQRLYSDLTKHRPVLVFTQAPSGEVETVLRLSSASPDLERPQGRVMGPYTSASALAFQAFWPDREREEYQQRHPFYEEGAHLWGGPQKLKQFLAETRRQGYATPPLGAKTYAVAAPVYGGNGQLVAVLGLSVTQQTLSMAAWRGIVKQVVQAAAELSGKQVQ